MKWYNIINIAKPGVIVGPAAKPKAQARDRCNK